jgi:hypothetical protein
VVESDLFALQEAPAPPEPFNHLARRFALLFPNTSDDQKCRGVVKTEDAIHLALDRFG